MKQDNDVIGNMWEKVISWVYPPRCLLCGKLLAVNSEAYFCKNCDGSIAPFDEEICEKCGAPVKYKEVDESFICEDCAVSVYSFERNISLFEYDKHMRDIIHSIKYGKNPYFAKLLGEFCGHIIESDSMKIKDYLKGFDIIIPVPVYRNKLRERGFNQAMILAEVFSGCLDIPVMDGIVRRIVDTPPQSLVEVHERALNVRNVFEASADMIKDKSFIIVDDIFTTGSTMESIAKLLMKSGALKCASLTVCKALLKA